MNSVDLLNILLAGSGLSCSSDGDEQYIDDVA